MNGKKEVSSIALFYEYIALQNGSPDGSGTLFRTELGKTVGFLHCGQAQEELPDLVDGSFVNCRSVQYTFEYMHTVTKEKSRDSSLFHCTVNK